MEDEDFKSAESAPTLGPAYFASRRIADRFMANFTAEHFKPLIDEFVKEFMTHIYDDICTHLIGDTESNLQSKMWHMVDDTVKALLTGQRWALERYALGSTYDHGAVRAAVAAVIPEELQNARIKDLETEVADLKRSISYLRRD